MPIVGNGFVPCGAQRYQIVDGCLLDAQRRGDWRLDYCCFQICDLYSRRHVLFFWSLEVLNTRRVVWPCPGRGMRIRTAGAAAVRCGRGHAVRGEEATRNHVFDRSLGGDRFFVFDVFIPGEKVLPTPPEKGTTNTVVLSEKALNIHSIDEEAPTPWSGAPTAQHKRTSACCRPQIWNKTSTGGHPL